MADKDTKLLNRDDQETKEPKEYVVVLLNDDYTTKEFVVEVLMAIFHKKIEEANQIMHNVHNTGRGAVGIYTWDIAQTKVDQVHNIARQCEFPLKCIVEEA